MYIPFNELSDQARLWVYQANKKLSEQEMNFITKAGIEFTKGWTAHNKDLKASVEIFFDQFIVLSVDESAAAATGCSIDKSVHFMQVLEGELNIQLLDKSQVAYLKNDQIHLVPLPKVKEMVSVGELAHDSIIFNNMVSDVMSFKEMWQVKAKDSWMSRYF
jgi:hypothetical protein